MENESLEDFQSRDGAPEGFADRTFVINDMAQATWAMRKLAVSQRRIDAVKRQAAEEIDRIERWVATATRSDQSTVEYFTQCLSNYIKRLRVDEDRKSLALPDGLVKSREVPEKIHVDDLDAFLKWADNAGDAYRWVRIKREIDMPQVKADVFYSAGCVVDTHTGETVEGLSHVPSSISVTVEVSE